MFLNDLLLEVPKSDDHFRLYGDLIYQGNQEPFIMKRGFRTDLGSIPRALRWLISSYGGGATRCYVFHDWLCDRVRRGEFSRRDADALLERALREEGVHWLQARLTWAGVRVGSRMKDADERDWMRLAQIAPLAPILLAPWILVKPWQWAWDLLTSK